MPRLTWCINGSTDRFFRLLMIAPIKV